MKKEKTNNNNGWRRHLLAATICCSMHGSAAYCGKTSTARQRQILARIVNGTESVAIAIRKQLQKI